VGQDIVVRQDWVSSAKPLVAETSSGAPAREGFDVLRALDLLGMTIAALLLFPLMTLVALAIYAADRGPIFYGHVRVGRMGQTFRCWKFRSMVVDSDEVLRRHLERDPAALAEWEASHKLRNDPRITPIGRLLRRSSLDELPQLWNVLVGEMSLVGPRPIIVKEISRYQSYFSEYCRCRPGITGLWQISGRNDMTYQQRVALDVKFARTKSVWLYLFIIASTIPAVLARRGAY
jgi:exopolysaccharide production protein ExoY